jgi:hypothetical protein
MDLIEKAQRTFLLLKFAMRLSHANKDRVLAIQTKKGFTKGRISRIHFLDINKHYDLVVQDGIVQTARLGKPVVFVYIKEFCTLKHLRLGTKVGMDPATERPCVMQYTLLNAWASGDISTHGEASTNDMLAFLDVIMDVMAMIPEDEMMKLVGPCDHDVPSTAAVPGTGTTEIRAKCGTEVTNGK